MHGESYMLNNMATTGDADPLLSTSVAEEAEKYKKARNRQYRTGSVVVVILLILGISWIVAGTIDTDRFYLAMFIPGLMALMLGGTGVVAVIIMALTSFPKEEAFLQSISRGEYLLRWSVSRDEWMTYVTDEYGPSGRSKKTKLWKVILSLVINVTLVIIVTVVVHATVPESTLVLSFHMPGTLAVFLVSFTLGAFFFMIFGGLPYLLEKLQAWRAQRYGPYETILAKGGILFGDSLILWRDGKEKQNPDVFRLNSCTLLTESANTNLIPVLKITMQAEEKEIHHYFPFSHDQKQEMERVLSVLRQIAYNGPTNDPMSVLADSLLS